MENIYLYEIGKVSDQGNISQNIVVAMFSR